MDVLKKKRLHSLICKFRPQELPEIIGCIFSSLFTWDDVKYIGISQKINLLKSSNVASLCLKLYQDCKPTNQDVQNILYHLMFLDAVYHDNILWNCAVLLNKEEDYPTDIEDLNRRIVRAYRTEARDTEVISKHWDDIVWVMLIEKIITKKGIKHGKPFYSAINTSIEKQYIFYHPKRSDDNTGPDHVLLLANALGYDSYKKIIFQGRDVKSMFNMVKRHEKPSNAIVLYQPTRIHQEGNVLDFTLCRERMAYAKQILPPGSTNLSEFTVHSKNEWRGEFELPESPLITSQLQIKVKGRNSSVEDVLRALISQNLVTIPVPQYITSLPSLDRNYIKIKLDPQKLTERSGVSFSD